MILGMIHITSLCQLTFRELAYPVLGTLERALGASDDVVTNMSPSSLQSDIANMPGLLQSSVDGLGRISKQSCTSQLAISAF